MAGRVFNVRHVAPLGVTPAPAEDVAGGFAFGALDAARRYAAQHLPGFDVVPVASTVAPGVWRVECIDHGGQRGALLMVREVSF